MADGGRLSKPQLRGLLHSAIRKNVIVGMVLAAISGVAFQYTVCEPRKRRYAEFYRNYDPEVDYRNMVKMGADFSVEQL
uniref:Unkown protein n=1 Tax=Riptortus pedestris TaxID=329032 RepID=R4WIE5_RIPPE|nr:unkown protein [Riptortus pedestris]